mgnify:CR=1 FL=1
MDEFFIEDAHQYPANEVAIGYIHLFLFEEILEHVGDVSSTIVD